jgi:hypothetical protein
MSSIEFRDTPEQKPDFFLTAFGRLPLPEEMHIEQRMYAILVSNVKEAIDRLLEIDDCQMVHEVRMSDGGIVAILECPDGFNMFLVEDIAR